MNCFKRTLFHAGSALDTFLLVDDVRIADGSDDGAVWTVSGTERTALTFGPVSYTHLTLPTTPYV